MKSALAFTARTPASNAAFAKVKGPPAARNTVAHPLAIRIVALHLRQPITRAKILVRGAHPGDGGVVVHFVVPGAVPVVCDRRFAIGSIDDFDGLSLRNPLVPGNVEGGGVKMGGIFDILGGQNGLLDFVMGGALDLC